MRKISKRKKFIRVFKRKLLKPLLASAVVSLIIYLGISNIIIQKRMVENTTPKFIITRISDSFDETEFMHMLLTLQEIRKHPKTYRTLLEYTNNPNPTAYSKLLEYQLNQMNWSPEAFHSRIQKLYHLHTIYSRVVRLEDTITFLSNEITAERLPAELKPQIDLLTNEHKEMLSAQLSPAEYDFMKKYGGIVIRLQQQNISQD